MSKFDPPKTTPTAYGYGRVSHLKSLQKGESIPAQEQRIKEYYEAHLATDGVKWGGCENDGTNISAYRIMFSCRPAGKRLMEKLKPGDHLILDKVDRIWRSLEDFVRLMRRFEAKGINVHIVSFLGSSIQNNTPMGDFMLKLFVLMSEMESTIKSERIREALTVVRNKGRRFSGNVPFGCRIVKHPHPDDPKRTVSILHWCEKKRTIMAEIVRLIDEEQLEWEDAFPKIESFIAKVERRKERSPRLQATERNSTWRLMYAYETAYRYLAIREPCEIPKADILKEAARQYRRQRTEDRAKKNKKLYKSTIPKISAEHLLELAASR